MPITLPLARVTPPWQGKDQLFFLGSTQKATPQTPYRRMSGPHLSPTEGLDLILSSYLSHFPIRKWRSGEQREARLSPGGPEPSGAFCEQYECPNGPSGLEPATCLGRPVARRAEESGPSPHKPTTSPGAAFGFSRRVIHEP